MPTYQIDVRFTGIMAFVRDDRSLHVIVPNTLSGRDEEGPHRPDPVERDPKGDPLVRHEPRLVVDNRCYPLRGHRVALLNPGTEPFGFDSLGLSLPHMGYVAGSEEARCRLHDDYRLEGALDPSHVSAVVTVDVGRVEYWDGGSARPVRLDEVAPLAGGGWGRGRHSFASATGLVWKLTGLAGDREIVLRDRNGFGGGRESIVVRDPGNGSTVYVCLTNHRSHPGEKEPRGWQPDVDFRWYYRMLRSRGELHTVDRLPVPTPVGSSAQDLGGALSPCRPCEFCT